MSPPTLWARALVIAGLVGMLIGAIDPLEGSLIILPGAGMVALGAFLVGSRHRKLLCWSFALVAIGVAALRVLSAFGGIRVHPGDSGRSSWWGTSLLPYPVGWILGVLGASFTLVELSKNPDSRKVAVR